MLVSHAPALRVLLSGAIDYAGLFPPAALDMVDAVREYLDSRAGADQWALGRFVVPATRLLEFDSAVRASPAAPDGVPIGLSVLASEDLPAALESIAQFEGTSRASLAGVEAIECRANDPMSAAAQARAVLPPVECWVEIPLDADVGPILDALQAAGGFPKIRTGGTAAGAFPEPDLIVSFLRLVVQRGLPFKATAGLHHLLRGQYRYTYASDSAAGPMYGYLNLFLATALLQAGGSAADARALLLEARAEAFEVTEQGVRWNGQLLDLGALRRLRRDGLRSFGSCSFREPLDELSLLAPP